MKNIIIRINKEELLNKFNENELNPELGNYINNKCSIKDLKDEVHISIYLENDLKSKDHDQITFLFKDYFEEKLVQQLEQQKKENIFSLLLFIIGTVFLIAYYFVNAKNIAIISEMLLIFGWVAIWEFFYKILFIQNKELYQKKKLQKLLSSKIFYL